MADDRIQLILDLGASGKNAAEVRLELERLNAAAKSVGDTYEVLAVSGHGYELGEERITIAQKRATQAMEEAAAEAKRLALEEQRLADEAIDKVTRAAIEQTQAQKAMSLILAESTTRTNTAVVATAKLTPESRAAAKAQAEMGRGILQTSYAVQDFTSQLGSRGLVGGLAAVQNNIPGILAGIGAGAGLAGVLSLASVGVGILIENWEKLGLAFKNANIEAQAAESTGWPRLRPKLRRP